MYVPIHQVPTQVCSAVESKIRRHEDIKGSLSNYDDDHNDDFKKTIGLIIKTTALYVHHAF